MGFLQIKDIRVKSFVVALIIMSSVSAFGFVKEVLEIQQMPDTQEILTTGAKEIMEEGPVARVLIWFTILGLFLASLAVMTLWRFATKQMVQTQSAKYDTIIELLKEIKADLRGK